MILKNAKIILENEIIDNGWIEIKNKKIFSINKEKYFGSNKEVIDLKNNILMPGFIDCHIHGGYGYDYDTATLEGYTKVAQNLPKEGITRYCQTSVTQTDKIMSDNLKVYSEWMKNCNKGKQARQIDLHIEGPFISENKKGAHNEKDYLKMQMFFW